MFISCDHQLSSAAALRPFSRAQRLVLDPTAVLQDLCFKQGTPANDKMFEVKGYNDTRFKVQGCNDMMFEAENAKTRR
jgi:hypothetical protein